MCFPSLPPQQQIEIKLRTPRSGDVNYAWNHEQSDANLMLKYLFIVTERILWHLWVYIAHMNQ